MRRIRKDMTEERASAVLACVLVACMVEPSLLGLAIGFAMVGLGAWLISEKVRP